MSGNYASWTERVCKAFWVLSRGMHVTTLCIGEIGRKVRYEHTIKLGTCLEMLDEIILDLENSKGEDIYRTVSECRSRVYNVVETKRNETKHVPVRDCESTSWFCMRLTNVRFVPY
jgi:hypothetical protein